MMVDTIPAKQTASMQTQIETPLYLPNAASTAKHVWTQALEFCTRKMALESPDAVVERLCDNDRVARQYCLYSVAKETSIALGDLDPEIRAIYTLDYDATPYDLCFHQASIDSSPVHLIVWTGRKTAALDAMIASLDHALTQICNDLIDTHSIASLLDVQVIDDDQVESQVGYGALLSSIHHQPIQVWSRHHHPGRDS
jgi:hypothetical protein